MDGLLAERRKGLRLDESLSGLSLKSAMKVNPRWTTGRLKSGRL
jgi:hypothetical protein